MKIQAFPPHVGRERVASWLHRRAQEGVADGTEEGQAYRESCRALYKADGTVLVLTRDALEVTRADELGVPRRTLHLAVHFRARGFRMQGGKRVRGWWPRELRGKHAVHWAELVLGEDLDRALFAVMRGDEETPATIHWRLFTDPTWEPVAADQVPADALQGIGYHPWSRFYADDPVEAHAAAS